MRMVLMGLLVLLGGAQEKAPPAAKVRLAAKINGGGRATSGDTTTHFAYLSLPDKVQVKAITTNDALTMYQQTVTKSAEASRKRAERLRELVKKFKDKPNKIADLVKKDTEEGRKLDAESSYVVVEGALTPGKELTMKGTLRDLDRAKRDKDLPLGSALIEGEAVVGDFTLGKDTKTTLAIRNGKSLILVAGKLPEKPLKGTIRVVGRLRPPVKDGHVIEATRVEAAK